MINTIKIPVAKEVTAGQKESNVHTKRIVAEIGYIKKMPCYGAAKFNAFQVPQAGYKLKPSTPYL